MAPLRRRPSAGLPLLLLILVMLAGCGSSAGASPSGAQFTNPVYAHNFADPYIIRAGKTYYAYGTGTCTKNLQGLKSSDLVHWSGPKELLPAVPRWADDSCNSFFQNKMLWAPEVLHRSDGKYVLYYVAHWSAHNIQCVTFALGSTPQGPFVDRSRSPLVCQRDQGGSIDPDIFHDSKGALTLLWKNDGNCCGLPTYLWSQRLDATGTRLTGTRVKLLRNDAPWEGSVIEAPSMWNHAGKYYLFFSANAFNTADYAVGYATCTGPRGPCKDAPENPILTSHCRAVGPGHQGLVVDRKGQTWIAYHAWRPGAVGDSPGGPGRLLWLDRVVWNNGKPVVHGPTCGAEPSPR